MRALRIGATWLLLLALVPGLGSCQRRRYEPLREDSTGVAASDSFAILSRDVVAMWDQGDGETAARTTAGLVLADLRARAPREGSAAWQTRAEALLDSLSIGAEIAAAPCALVINFFSRANPEQGSWPWLYWCGPQAIEAEAIEGRGFKLGELAARGMPVDSLGHGPAPGVAALYGRRAAIGQQPLLMVWGRAPQAGGWQIRQTLGPDSLGGFGSGEFLAADTTVELVVRSYRPTPRFDECATCPHFYRIHRFRWSGASFTRSAEEIVPSPYASFVRFVTALSLGDLELATRFVSEPRVLDEARRFEIGAPRGLWRAAPATDETAHDMVFLRGPQDAYRVTFEPRGDEWRITGITPTSVSIE